jgi:hypothetical protein
MVSRTNVEDTFIDALLENGIDVSGTLFATDESVIVKLFRDVVCT